MKTIDELLGVAIFPEHIQKHLDQGGWSLSRDEMQKFANAARAEMREEAAKAVEWETCEEDCEHATCAFLHGLADTVRGLGVE